MRFTVELAINPNSFEKFDSIAQTMIAGTQGEPGALVYDWYLSSDRKRCRLVEAYADQAAVLAHLTGPVVQGLVPKLLETSSVTRFEVYGDPGAEAGEMLRGVGAEIFVRAWGMNR